MGKKTIIFDRLENRTAIARGYIRGRPEIVDKFIETLDKALQESDADPENESLSEEDRKDFLDHVDDEEDDTIIINPEKKIHTLDDLLS